MKTTDKCRKCGKQIKSHNVGIYTACLLCRQRKDGLFSKASTLYYSIAFHGYLAQMLLEHVDTTEKSVNQFVRDLVREELESEGEDGE